MNAIFTPLQLDAIKELGNIGSGNAATSLSVLLNKPVNLEVGEVQIIPVDGFFERLSFSEAESLSLANELSEDLHGFFWLLIEKKHVGSLCETLTGMPGYEDPSVMEEISNILGGNYINALSQLLNLTIDMAPPKFLEPATEFLSQQKQVELGLEGVLFIQNTLTIDGEKMDVFLSTILDKPSLDKVLEVFGL